ncbi:E3 ubiquitin-protein ligase Topors-like [Arvicola amphibius]|uniref:E3 ubiquitin-protein ligase Topors-like n=1 Tax=Arvicola amphibius TaxID=1047088 RepID=UPI0018E3E8FE|nr:E3 ubiquitin-protein ligase Topors-like [Arvicola amphibius]
MAVELSSNCECPNCLGCSQSESDWNFPLGKREDVEPLSRSSKKSSLSPIMKRFLSQSCFNDLKNDDKEDPVFFPSEEESSIGFSQRQNLSETSKTTKRKIKPSRELTIQGVLKKLGDRGKFQLYSRSLGPSKEHVVATFRRALYYSGIWVKHVQGSKLENHFSANYFKRNPSSLHRLIPWLKRELTAVYGDYGYTVKNILAAILHHMTEFDLESESFTHLLEPYLLQHTCHFLHEFISFVYSSYDVETYDRSAVYQCPLSTWVKNKSFISAPVLSLPDDLSLVISQQGTKQSKNTQIQWYQTGKRPLSDLKQFPNGNFSVQSPITSTTHQKTGNKFRAWTKDEKELDDFKDVVCTTNLLLDWDNLRENVPGTDVQEKKTESPKLLPDHVEDQPKSGTTSHAWRAAVDSNRVPPRKPNLKQTNVLSPGQQVHDQKKEIEKKKKKLEVSSPKVFQRLSRERTQISSKSRETDLSMNCISGNVPFPTRNGKMPVSFTKKKRKCSQSSQSIDVGSHHSTRTQIPSSSRKPISKSQGAGPRKQSISRDQSNLSLRGSYKSKCFTQNIHGEPSKGNLHGCESACRLASLIPVHQGKSCLTTEKRQSFTSLGNCDSQTGRECGSPTGPQTETYVSPSQQQKKGKNLLGRARKIGTLGPPKSKYQCEGSQTAAEFCVELGDLNDQRPMNCHSERATSCRK